MPRHQVSVRAVVGRRAWPRRCLLAIVLVCPIVAITAQSALAKTVALWHMNEKSGSVMHDSVGNHNGTLFNVTLGEPGWRGSAYGFARSSLTVPSAHALNPGRRAHFGVTLHLKTTTVPQPGHIWTLIRKGHWNTKGGEWKVTYHHSGKVSCGFKGSHHQAVVKAGPAVNDGTWHTVRCVKTRSAIQLIVDGVKHSKTARLGKIGNGAPVLLGAYPGGGYYIGSLDEVSIARSRK